MGTWQVKAPRTSLFLPRYSHFSWISASWIIAILKLLSRFLKKLILTTFCQCSHVFYGRMGFRDPYSFMPEVFSEVASKISIFWRHLGFCVLSHVWLFATPWTVACQAPLSVEFSRQKYWSGSPFPSPGDLLRPRDWMKLHLLHCRQSLYLLSHLGRHLKIPDFRSQHFITKFEPLSL